MKKLFSAIFASYDIILAICAVVLSGFGLIAVYSATRTFGNHTGIAVQTVAVVVGIAGMLVISFFDYKQLKYLSKYIFACCIIMLVCVLLLGMTGVWGSKSWIKIGKINIQPSELAKCGFIVTFSYHLCRVKEKLNTFPVLTGLFIHAAIHVFLIMLQPDFGTAAVFVFVFAVMIFFAGLSPKIYLPLLSIGVAAIPFLYNLLNDYQKNRIRVFLDPQLDPTGAGYNVIQSKLSLGSGGLLGNGYLQGVSTQEGYLPAKHTDFIFSSIGEEWGFVGTVCVAAMLFFIVLRIIQTAKKTEDLFGKYICVGSAAMIFFHSIENMGMCIGIMPVTGIPLPFISYGGTAMITSFACVGLVLSVAHRTGKGTIFK